MQNFYLHRDGQNLGPYTKEDLYQNDAFGNVFNGGSKGAAIKKAKFAQRFSTKYQDGETGLVYFGYRYDGPAFGRWVRYFLHGSELDSDKSKSIGEALSRSLAQRRRSRSEARLREAPVTRSKEPILTARPESESDINRWTSRSKAAANLDIIKGKARP